jgi:acyl-CoA thioester hydrolase
MSIVMTSISNSLPVLSRTASVDPAWVDIYGHMNMAYYVKLFDDLGHDMLSTFGLGAEYTVARRLGLFTVEAKIKYIKEVVANDPLKITLKIDDFDDKRLWSSLEMRHADRKYLAATMEQIALNVSLDTRRATPFPPDVTVTLAAFRASR